jgi:hypothetical protein
MPAALKPPQVKRFVMYSVAKKTAVLPAHSEEKEMWDTVLGRKCPLNGIFAKAVIRKLCGSGRGNQSILIAEYISRRWPGP